MIVERLELEPSSLEELGLREVKMTGLGRFVALTGKNGAGKSRVLEVVHGYIPRLADRSQSPDSTIQLIADLRERLVDKLPHEEQTTRAMLAGIERASSPFREVTGKIDSDTKAVRFSAHAGVLQTPESLTREQLREVMDEYLTDRRFVSNRKCLAYFAEVESRRTRLSRDATRELAVARDAAEQSWAELQRLSSQMLGADVRIDPLSGVLLLFDRPSSKAKLSQGQTILLQLAVALHAHCASLDNTVLFMDEPENHLHPAAVIDVLERLKNASGRMQFWIATHSVPLLAYLHAQDAKCLWYVEDGRVQHAGKLQQHVLESLLGNTERLEQLRTFVALPEQVAIEQFATECLLPPGVSDRGKGDPQVQQISEVIETLRAERNRPLEVLDYGAGRGRLLAGMFADNASDFRDRISYRALDEYPNGREDCVRVIESVYGSSEGRYFSELNKFDNDRRVPVDLLVLCNVLHEMPPEDWQRRFGAGNDFARMLAPDGFLLVVEDQEIHVGEHAHKYGFLLLDTAELRALFAVEQRDIDEKRFVVTKHPKRGDRLKAHWIAASLVERVTHDTVVAALTLLKKRSCDEINRLRSQPGGDGKQNGQAHARAAMLFANASLALDARGKS